MAKKKKRKAGSDAGVVLALFAGTAVMVGVMALPFLLATPNGK